MLASTERLISIAFGTATLLFVAIGVAAWRSFEQVGDASGWVAHTHEVLEGVDRLAAEMRDIETGQRGYLLTGDERFLEPYRAALPRVEGALADVHALTADNPTQQRHLEVMRGVIDDKLAFVRTTIEVRRARSAEAAAALVAGGRGKAAMDRFRRLAQSMRDEEERLLAQRTAELRSASWRTTALLLGGDTIAFVGMSFAAFALMRDVSRRRRRRDESALLRLRRDVDERAAFELERLPRLLEQLPVPVLFLASDGHVTIGNRRLRALFGDALLAAPDLDTLALAFVGPDGRPLRGDELPFARTLTHGVEVNGCEIEHVTARGKRCRLRVHAAPMREVDGTVAGAIVSFEDPDASDAALAEQQRAQRFGELFTTLVGHDVRNPLTVLAAGTDALLRRRLPENEARIVDRMRSSVSRASHMVDQTIDLVHARLGGGLPVKRAPADLGDVARETIDRLLVQRPEHTIELTTRGHLDGLFDAERIGGVVAELVDNAVRHGGDGADGAHVHVAARSEGERLVVDVVGGARVPDDLRPVLFDPFRRAEDRVRLRSAGAGMGLYLSSQIAQAHGGAIRLVDDAERTTFRLELPRGEPS